MNAPCYLLRSAKGLITCTFALAVLAGVVSSAPAQLGLQYTFGPGDDLTVPGGIHDQSGNSHDGTVIDCGQAEFAMGPAGNMNAIHLDGFNTGDEFSGSGINTGVMVDDATINIFQGPYTCMCWVMRDRDSGEDMIFGTPKPYPGGQGSLHQGFRGNQIYFGYWGSGVGRDSNSPGNESPSFEWHHVTWRFNGAGGAGNQDIFVDGALVHSHMTPNQYGGILLGDGNMPNLPTNLLIGRTVANGGAFLGTLADVRVYNVDLDDATIATIAGSPP